MSKAYRLRIAGVQVQLHLDRSIALNVDLLPILAAGRMLTLLQEQLQQAGALQQADGRWRISKTLTDWLFDTATSKLEVRPRNQEQIKDIEIQVYDEWLGHSLRSALDALAAEGQGVIQLGQEELGQHSEIQELLNQGVNLRRQAQEELSQRFFGEVQQARQLINQSLKEVYRQALQEKARSLGNVVSMSEQEQGGEFRIRLEIQGGV